jgi:NADH-quinone oxidoreductase subunit A
MFENFYPILFLVVVATVIALVLLTFSVVFGKRTKQGKKDQPYECGVTPEGTTKDPIPVKYYLVGIMFILFDIEVVFLYPYAVISRKLGLFGLAEIVIFVLILLVGYVYILSRGALKWD